MGTCVAGRAVALSPGKNQYQRKHWPTHRQKNLHRQWWLEHELLDTSAEVRNKENLPTLWKRFVNHCTAVVMMNRIMTTHFTHDSRRAILTVLSGINDTIIWNKKGNNLPDTQDRLRNHGLDNWNRSRNIDNNSRCSRKWTKSIPLNTGATMKNRWQLSVVKMVAK